jgi:hypothetical protein
MVALHGSGPVVLDAAAIAGASALAYWLCFSGVPNVAVRNGASLALAVLVGLQLLLAGLIGVYQEYPADDARPELFRILICGFGAVVLAVQVVELGSFFGFDDLLSRPFVALLVALDVLALVLIRVVRIAMRRR